MTVTITPRTPATVASHVFSTPTVRELPPVARPGTFAATW
jgi:hypothetical protein